MSNQNKKPMNRQKMWTTKENELLNRAIALTPKSLVQGCEEASRMLHREGFNRSPKACYLHYIKVIRIKKHSIVVEAPKKEPNQTQQLVKLVLANRNLVTKAKEYKALLKKSLKSTEEFISDMETMYKYLTDNQ